METLLSKTIKYRFIRGCYARRKVTTNLQFSRFWTVGWENPPQKKTSKQEVFFKIRVEGFEPPTFWFVAKRSIQLGYTRLFYFLRFTRWIELILYFVELFILKRFNRPAGLHALILFSTKLSYQIKILFQVLDKKYFVQVLNQIWIIFLSNQE